ncbi:MAG: serine hydrolase [Acidobacteria bacterium]|nr:serine hydrolase [Acidobacteriota bacterium]
MAAVEAGRRVVADAIARSVFPAAAIEVGSSDGPIWSDALGTVTFDAGAAPTTGATIFDLASLTKPMATTTILLEHASGLPARLVDPPPDTRREFEHEIGTIKLEYAPRTQSIYSDLGFLLLGFLAADVGRAPLDVLLERAIDPRSVRLQPDRDLQRGPEHRDPGLVYTVPPLLRTLAAPTEPMDVDPRRGRRLVGEVHDNYAAALGGVAGHAGVFGTAAAVGAFARTMLRGGEMVRLFTTRTTVPGSSRALGWDTMLPTSSCGTRMSPRAFGHVGFTGTSLWIDPARDRYFVLLTNRVCGGGTLDEMRQVRRAFHDALGEL